jgi:hypothetical protein
MDQEKKDNIIGVVGDHNQNVGNHHETHNYAGMNRNDLIGMMEERFQHMLKKDSQIEQIFEENRKLTDEVIRQNADFRIYNEAFLRKDKEIAELTGRIAELTDKLLKKD